MGADPPKRRFHRDLIGRLLVGEVDVITVRDPEEHLGFAGQTVLTEKFVVMARGHELSLKEDEETFDGIDRERRARELLRKVHKGGLPPCQREPICGPCFDRGRIRSGQFFPWFGSSGLLRGRSGHA